MNDAHRSDSPETRPAAPARRGWPGDLRTLLQLGKAWLTLFIVMTAFVGFAVASRGGINWPTLLFTLLGTGLTSWGSLALNQWWEVERDARMRRTEKRPLPSGRIGAPQALVLGLIAVAVGLAVLGVKANLLTAGLGLATVLIYVLIYTPLKPQSPFCTLVGAICGAIPPMMGWTAAAGRFEIGAGVIGATLFIWQIPHFLALAWLYRDDYARGGFRMLPVLDRSGQITFQTVILYTLALIPIGWSATYVGMAGLLFMFGSFVLGSAMLFLGVKLYLQRTDANARILFFASLIYLPILLVLLLVDRGVHG